MEVALPQPQQCRVVSFAIPHAVAVPPPPVPDMACTAPTTHVSPQQPCTTHTHVHCCANGMHACSPDVPTISCYDSVGKGTSHDDTSADGPVVPEGPQHCTLASLAIAQGPLSACKNTA